MNVNHENDFAIVEGIDSHLRGLPFVWRYSVRNRTYEVSYDGNGGYTNCEKVDTGRIKVNFHSHHLPIGNLHCHRMFYKESGKFDNGFVEMVCDENVPVTLVDGGNTENLIAHNCVIKNDSSSAVEIDGSDISTDWEVEGTNLIL